MLAYSITRATLIFMSVITFGIGLSLLIGGLMVKYSATGSMQSVLETAGNQLNAEQVKVLKNVLKDSNILSFITSASVALGIVIVMMSLIGFIGLLVRKKLILLVYVFLMVVMVIINSIFLTAFIINKNKGTFDLALQTLFVKFAEQNLLPYNKIVNNSFANSRQRTFTSIINAMQMQKQCCFIQNNGEFNDSLWRNELDNPKLMYPITCCKKVALKVGKNITNDGWPNLITADDVEFCTTTPEAFFNKPCVKFLGDVLRDKSSGIITILGVGIGFGLLCVLVAIVSLPKISHEMEF